MNKVARKLRLYGVLQDITAVLSDWNLPPALRGHSSRRPLARLLINATLRDLGALTDSLISF